MKKLSIKPIFIGVFLFLVLYLSTLCVSPVFSSVTERLILGTTFDLSNEDKKQPQVTGDDFGLPEGYKLELLLEPSLLSPHRIAATANDQLLVAEHYGCRLLKIDPISTNITKLCDLPRGSWDALLSDGADGAYMMINSEVVHISGTGIITTYTPHFVFPSSLSSDGKIYGFTTSEVVVVSGPGQEPISIAGGFSRIFDLARALDGTLYVADWDWGNITKIYPNGTRQFLPAQLNQKDPIDLGFAPNGTLYVNAMGKFYRVDPISGYLTNIGLVRGGEGLVPKDFIFLSDGTACFVDPTYNNLLHVDFESEQLDLIIVGQGNSPALDVDPNKTVFIGDNSGFPARCAQVLQIQANGSTEVYIDGLDPVTDLSFSPDGNLIVTTFYWNSTQNYGASSVLLITPQREVQILAHWNSTLSEFRILLSVSVHPLTGLAIAYDHQYKKLISVNNMGNISVLPHTFHYNDTKIVHLDHASDGTLYALEVNQEGYETGPLVERTIIRFDEAGNPVNITDFSHIGSQTAENLAIGANETIYAVGYPLEGNYMSLWQINSTTGAKTQLSGDLPIDPLAVAVDTEDNIYLACSAGLYRIIPGSLSSSSTSSSSLSSVESTVSSITPTSFTNLGITTLAIITVVIIIIYKRRVEVA